jgi:transcriptional regulator with XRE-family HTH domain
MSQSSSDMPPDLGKRIAGLREQRGWTQRELGDRAGLSVTFLSEVENGKRNLSSGKLLRIADELGASLDYLQRGIQTDPPQRTTVQIPPELSDAAEEMGWKFAQTRALLQVSELIKERRSPEGEEVTKTYTKHDWIKLYKRLFE